MNISDIQVKKIINRVVTSILKSGNNPTDKTMTYYIKKWFKDRIPGYPSLKLRKAKNRAKSDSENYNMMLNEIEDDLDTLFTSLHEQNNTVLNNFATNENEKIKLSEDIRIMENEVHKVMTQSSKSNSWKYSLAENFASFTNIDMYNTDAFIDIQGKEAKLEMFNRNLQTIPLQKASVKIDRVKPSKNAVTETINGLKYSIDDYNNTYWSLKVEYSKEHKPDKVRVDISIKLDNEYEFSQINLIPQSPKGTYVDVYHKDNNAYKKINEKSKKVSDKTSWYFNPIKTDELKISLKKEEADNLEENVLSYLFGIKNISIGYRQYKKNSTIETKALSIDNNKDNKSFTINTLALDVDDEVPKPDTDINYYIKMKENTNLFNSPSFDNPSVWNADYYYDVGGIDGGSFSGNDTTWSFYQEVDLVSGKDYTINGYVKAPGDKTDVRICGGNQNLGNHYITTNGEWTYFEFTSTAQESGIQRIYILDRKKEGYEVQADKFCIAEGTVASPVVYSQATPISPTDENNPDYKQYIKLDNIAKNTETFSSSDLTNFETKYQRQYYKYTPEYPPIHDKIKLYKGVNKWAKSTYTKKMPIYEELGLTAWNNQQSISWKSDNWGIYPINREFTLDYVDNISFDTSTSSGADKHYRFTTWIYCPENQDYESNTLNGEYEINNEVLYVNNKKVEKMGSESGYSYKIKFHKGWNKIDIVYYIDEELDNSGTLQIPSNYSNIIDLSRIEYTKQRARKSSIKEVSLHDLYSNYDYRDDNVYAVTQKGDIVFNNSTNIDYTLEYSYDTNNVDTVKIIAELSTENPYRTPKIRKMKLNTSL